MSVFFRLGLSVIGVFVLISLSACETANVAVSTGVDDTPEARVLQGEAALRKAIKVKSDVALFNDARVAFERAAALDPNHLPAWKGLVEVALAKKSYDQGYSYVEKALAKSLKLEDQMTFEALFFRLKASEKPDGWFYQVQKRYNDFYVKHTNKPETAPLHVAFGMAALEASEYDVARKALRKNLNIGGAGAAEANRLLKRVDDIERAGATGKSTRTIAGKEAITRHDLVVMLMDILDAPKYLGVTSSGANGGSGDFKGDKRADDIVTIDSMKLRYPRIRNGSFNGDDTVKRMEFAILMEDLIIARTGDKSLSSRFIGSSSPFADLSSSHVSYNSMMLSTNRGLLSAGLTGEANIHGTVNGAEAIGAFRRLLEIQ